jgi:HSP20 family protein
MNVVKYDPFRDLRGLQDEMNRLFSGTFSRGSQDEIMRGAWSPSVDIFENKDQIVLEAELPGMTIKILMPKPATTWSASNLIQAIA